MTNGMQERLQINFWLCEVIRLFPSLSVNAGYSFTYSLIFGRPY